MEKLVKFGNTKMCVLRTNKDGKTMPCMPDGTPIPCIARHSISVCDDAQLFSAGLMRVKLELIMALDNFSEGNDIFGKTENQ